MHQLLLTPPVLYRRWAVPANQPCAEARVLRSDLLLDHMIPSALLDEVRRRRRTTNRRLESTDVLDSTAANDPEFPEQSCLQDNRLGTPFLLFLVRDFQSFEESFREALPSPPEYPALPFEG